MRELSEKEFLKLDKSIEWSNRQLEFQRNQRVDSVKQFVGKDYAESGAPNAVLLPMLSLIVLIISRKLVANNPQALITPKPEFSYLRPTALNFQLAVNQIPAEIELPDTLRRLVVESMFSPWGVVKVGLCDYSTALGHKYGRPFVDLVTMDDYFCDMSAKYHNLIDYEGNDYWLDYDEVMDTLGKGMDLKADESTPIGPNGEKRAENVTNSESADVYKDKIRLRDVWLPSERILITYAVTKKKVLKTIARKEEFGPYIKNWFADVPGNLMPLPMVALWKPLHKLANTLFDKVGLGADAQKSVLGFSGTDTEAVAAFKGAKDGEGINYGNQRPEKLEAGGFDKNTLALALQSKDLLSYFAGNIDSLGGLSAVSATATQDKLMAQAAGSQVDDMAGKFYDTVRKIMKVLAYYEWTDPVRRRTLDKPVPGTDVTIPVEWNKKSKKGKFEDYKYDFDVYSMQDDSPGSILQKLKMYLNDFVMPLQAEIARGGGSVNAKEILEEVARLINLKLKCNVIEWTDNAPAAVREDMPKPANTTRQYDRVSSAPQTQQGASADIQKLLLSDSSSQ